LKNLTVPVMRDIWVVLFRNEMRVEVKASR
jgi:hypothetical protein